LEETESSLHCFCMSLCGATHVVQWGGSDVYKVGGRIFAIVTTDASGRIRVTFKASQTSFELLKEAPGVRPAPYLASRGLKWLQWLDETTLDREALRAYLRQSHAMAMDGLSRKQRTALQFRPEA
jgi:predicted DNA-binding protein (MmcQ/YjbR family)